MNSRREFLRKVAAGATVATLPVPTIGESIPVETALDLRQLFSQVWIAALIDEADWEFVAAVERQDLYAEERARYEQRMGQGEGSASSGECAGMAVLHVERPADRLHRCPYG